MYYLTAIYLVNMKANEILTASDINELRSLGSYIEIKSVFEKELDNKLGVKGWKSFFIKIQNLKKIVSTNKDLLFSVCDNKSFKDSKKEISEILKIKIKAKGWDELKKK